MCGNGLGATGAIIQTTGSAVAAVGDAAGGLVGNIPVVGAPLDTATSTVSNAVGSGISDIGSAL